MEDTNLACYSPSLFPMPDKQRSTFFPVTAKQERQETGGGRRDKSGRTWQLGDRMVLLGLGVRVFIRRPPVGIFVLHHLGLRHCFLLSALILHPITGTRKKVGGGRGLMYLMLCGSRHVLKEQASQLVASERTNSFMKRD